MLKKLKCLPALLLTILLGGCKYAVLDPKGVVAASEKGLLIDALLLMLIVVIPVIIMSFVFAWHFRAKNPNAKYRPKWAHSVTLEVVVWAVPCVIIIILATMTWITTHTLDPYRPLDTNKKPLVIQAVALDWKWLFIYPKQDIATLNYVRIPNNVQVEFQITADAPMNSFQIPSLAGQIYAMPGMRTRLHLMATHEGKYRGFSANYSGEGFSDMNFVAQVTSQADFDRWVTSVKSSPQRLNVAAYQGLVQPSEKVKPRMYSHVTSNLFKQIIMKYMQPNFHFKD